MKTQLKSRAVLMRLSIGMPGRNRQDKQVTEEVKADKGLGSHAGRWVKELFPSEALEPIQKIDGEARSYHDKVTLPFDAGIGILPLGLVMEYGDKMREFLGRRQAVVQNHFLAKWDKWVEWARTQHNGTFDESLYDKAEAAEKFYFRTEPLPVPDSTHFEDSASQLLGVDAVSVDNRVASAAKEAQRELLKRMMDPVSHIVKTLSKEKPRIFDSLIGNVEEIAGLAPKLNLSGDPAIDEFSIELSKLARYSADGLRVSEGTRTEARKSAEALLKRLEGYKL